MTQTRAQFGNLRGFKGRSSSEIDASYQDYLKRQEGISKPLEYVEQSQNPREAMRALLPLLTADLQRWLLAEGKKSRPEPSVTSRIDSLRLLLAQSAAWEASASPQDDLNELADKLAERIRTMRTDESSPEPPADAEPPRDADIVAQEGLSA